MTTQTTVQQRLNSQLDEEDQKQLVKALKNSAVSTRKIHRTLREHGIKISRDNLQNYRNTLTEGTK
jgi:uncharacterized protein YjaZ